MRTYVVYPIVLCLIGFVGCGQDKGADKSQEGTSQNEVALDASKNIYYSDRGRSNRSFGFRAISWSLLFAKYY